MNKRKKTPDRRIQIISIENEPLWSFYSTSVISSSKTRGFMLPLYKVLVNWLPAEIEGIICTSDLQGHAQNEGEPTLIGIQLPSQLDELANAGMIPPLKKLGAILAGDLFSSSQKRGGYGNTRPVWEKWGDAFRWVVGVAGNHDHFGQEWPRIPDFKKEGFKNIHVFDANTECIDGIFFGGISGCIGSSTKPFRATERDFADQVRNIWNEHTDITIMHDGPCGQAGQLGSTMVTKVLNEGMQGLVIRGHCFWDIPLATLNNGTQVVNCDSRIFLMTTI